VLFWVNEEVCCPKTGVLWPKRGCAAAAAAEANRPEVGVEAVAEVAKMFP